MHGFTHFIWQVLNTTCGLVQASKDCVQKTIKRLEDKIQGNVLKQILYAMHSSQVGSAVCGTSNLFLHCHTCAVVQICLLQGQGCQVKLLPESIIAAATVLSATM